MQMKGIHPMDEYLDGEDFICPASFAQQRLWFLHQWEPESAFYTVSRALALSGPLQQDALAQALNEMVERHEVLRTTFTVRAGVPMQRVAPYLHLSLPNIDLAHMDAMEQSREVARLLLEATLHPFDLVRGPLFRVLLLRLGETEHILHLSLHHIIADGWSLNILFRELAICYSRQLRACQAHSQEVQATPSLSALPIQYADYAVWQQATLQGSLLEQLLDYWKRQLAGTPPVLTLPADRPRPASLSFRGAHYPFALSVDLSRRLKQLSKESGVTLFMLLLAAFQVLLARYSGQRDIVVGTPIANRTRAEIEGLIGCFVNTLALRCNLADNPPFRQLLLRVRETCLDAYSHQDLPFEKLVEELQPQREPNVNPLFQVMFSLQNAPLPEPTLEGVQVRLLPLLNNTSKVDLSIDMEEGQQGLRGQVEYMTDLFDEATIARLVEHWRTLLEGIVVQPDLPVSRLPLLPAGERRQLLVEWNATRESFSPRSVVALFEEQVARQPEALALLGGTTLLTYDQLNQRANSLAHALLERGVGPGALVGLLLPRSPALIVGMLGVLKTGAAYLPLDSASPAGHLADMLEEARPTLLLSLEALRSYLPAHATEVLCLEEIASETNMPTGDLSHNFHPQQLAYVIYTSGSTGRPRGVRIPHEALWNHCQAVCLSYGLRPGDRVLQFASPGFDMAAEEIVPTLASGAALVFWPSQDALDLADFSRFLAEQRLSVLNLPASFWHAWVDELDRSESPLPASLRLVVTGSEPVLRERLVTWQRLVGGRVAWRNAYGVTEATITSTLYVPDLECEQSSSSTVPLGRPLANIQVYVLDDELQPLPIGIPGELYIGGPGLASGYLRQPALTAERLIPHPFSTEPGARLYRTGDLARYLPDGVLEYHGRLDNQVKIRGHRIELGEIEAALAGHPAVREAVVLAREYELDSRLVAYVVFAADQMVSTAALRSYLQQMLPAYMVPSGFVIVPELPMMPNGKVDRAALLALNSVDVESETAYVAPRTATEMALAELWATSLGCTQVSIHDNFFDLGGNSLLATRILARVRETLHIDLPLRALFESPTVAALAMTIAKMQPQAQARSLVALIDHDIDANTAQNILAEFSDLSEDDVDRLLAILSEEVTVSNE